LIVSRREYYLSWQLAAAEGLGPTTAFCLTLGLTRAKETVLMRFLLETGASALLYFAANVQCREY
jgi:hypothetical protein